MLLHTESPTRRFVMQYQGMLVEDVCSDIRQNGQSILGESTDEMQLSPTQVRVPSEVFIATLFENTKARG
jgi:hypothetical protein